MKRSAAPSQTGSGSQTKRPRFVSPISNHIVYASPGSVHSSADLLRSDSQPSSHSSPSLLRHVIRNTEVESAFGKSNLLLNMTCKDGKSTARLSHVNNASSAEKQIKRPISTIAMLASKPCHESVCQSALSDEARSERCLPPTESVVQPGTHPSSVQAETIRNTLMPSDCDFRFSRNSQSDLVPCQDICNRTSSARYFSVVWCKLSKKKHKKWEGDALLMTCERSAILYDLERKVIGRASGYKTLQLNSLRKDETLVIGGKEIQVLTILTEEQFKSDQWFSSPTSTESTVLVQSEATSKPFVNPCIKSSQLHSQVRKVWTGKKQDSTVPAGLVMPRPSPDHQWQHNQQGLPVVDVVLDSYLAPKLRKHQRAGVLFLYECVLGMRGYEGQGAILADDMGLGKTLQCITLVWTLLKQGPYGGQPVLKKVLIVTPGSLVKNWFLEFKKWLGPERLNVFAVSAENKPADFVKSNVHPVLIISYEMFLRCHELMKLVPFDLIICDEGHRLKNTTIKTAALLKGLACRKRIVLTGTPIQNDLQEFYAIVKFCNPALLGTSASFHCVYEEPIVASRQPKATAEEKELGAERAQELSCLTQMFILRRTQDINTEYLPPKVELVVFCRPSPLQVILYRQLIQHCLTGPLPCSSHLVCMSALRQLCSHPGLLYHKLGNRDRPEEMASEESQKESVYDGLLSYFPETFDASTISPADSGKLQVLSGLLSSIWAGSSTEKVVLVSNQTRTLDFLQVFCTSQGYSCLRLDGQTPTTHRQDIVNKFNIYSCHRVFLLSSKAGGIGLNLVGASRLILYDIDWNPANDLQAMARVWRDGQKGKVHIYRLLTTGTIEEKMYQRQITKQDLSGAVMELNTRNTGQFSLQDLKDVFSLNERTDCETHAMLSCKCEGDPQKAGPELSSRREQRQCQLGKSTTAQNQTSNLTMAQLLHWKHWRGEFAFCQKSWCLDTVGSSLSFLFWHETQE